MELDDDLALLARRFRDRYKSLSMLKGKSYSAKQAKRAYLDVMKLCRKHGIDIDEHNTTTD